MRAVQVSPSLNRHAVLLRVAAIPAVVVPLMAPCSCAEYLIDPHTGVFTLLVPASGAHGLTSRPGRRRRFCVLRARIGGRPSAPRRRVLGWNFRTSRRPGCRPARQPVTPAADHQAQATKSFG